MTSYPYVSTKQSLHVFRLYTRIKYYESCMLMKVYATLLKEKLPKTTKLCDFSWFTLLSCNDIFPPFIKQYWITSKMRNLSSVTI